MNKCDLEELVNVLKLKLMAIPLHTFVISERYDSWGRWVLVATAEDFELHCEDVSYAQYFSKQQVPELLDCAKEMWPKLRKLNEERKKALRELERKAADEARCKAIHTGLFPNSVTHQEPRRLSVFERIKSWWRGM